MTNTTNMIETICAHIHNDFEAGRAEGRFVISGGSLAADGLEAGRYYRLEGSRFNDGVHRHPAEDLADETFTGAIVWMRPPRAFLALAEEIAAWRAKYGGAAEGPYQSESVIGVYSYKKGGAAWQDAFAGRLNEWRKLS